MLKKAFLTICLALIGMGMQAQNYKYETVPGDIMQTRIYTLDNGLKVYLSVNKEKPRIDAHIAVRTGSRNDPAETTGLAHYLEHLMFKGTKQFGTTDPVAEAPLLDDIEARYEVYRTLTDPEERRRAYHEIDSVSQLAAKYFIPNEYDKLMSAIGSQGTNAYTSFDVTCYVENIPSNEVENWARVQADRFQNMVIRGFHTELEAVYEEKNIGMAQDSRKVWESLTALLCPTHPYGTQTTIGTQEHLKNPSITNIKNYFHRYYVPNNIAICMAGDFDPDEVISIIDRYFGSWKKSETLTLPTFPAQAPITAVRDTTVVGLEAENLMMAWRFGEGRSAENDTLDVIGDMLANGKAGLFEVDLEQTMKTRSVFAGTQTMMDYSAFIIGGNPKDNQSLEELRTLILEELEKFKRGEFDDDLLQSVINNKRLNYFRSMQNNRSRVSEMVDAFINGADWADVAGRLDRQSKMTKEQLTDFARRHLRDDNFICVYKRIGEDTSQKKIEKPEITAIPSNRDLSSNFLNDVKNAYVKPIELRFVDFDKDLTVTKTSNKLPLLYKQNTEDGLFDLSFMYDFGTEDVRGFDFAPSYLEYVGTDKKTVTQIKQEFYKLACSYNINVNDYYTTVNLSGLTENMPQALALLEDLLKNAKGDRDSYDKYVNLVIKEREDAKKDQNENFSRLNQYGIEGPYNNYLNTLSEKELRAADPQAMLDQLKRLGEWEHTVMYYGPMTEKELNDVLAKTHKTAKKLAAPPAGKEYTMQPTPQNEVIIAPYDAKNIYMMQYHNENKPYNKEELPVRSLFNAYFGSGMNGIVFQELRESRGLAYSAGASYVSPNRINHPEMYYTYIVSQNDKMPDCIRVFNNIIDTIPQSQAAFDIAKQSLIKNLQSQRTTKFNVLTTYYWTKKKGLDRTEGEITYEALPGLTLQDIVNFEKKNMTGKTYRYIILGDEKELDMDFLQKIGPIKRLSTEDIFEK
ncbi:MAG: insulinase family protein [Prevotella sp.]|nr:insulinase family protein [Prevotella sp.]